MARQKRSDDELRDASQAVLYEFNCLMYAYRFLDSHGVTNTSSEYQKFFVNALLHTFLLAARNLCEFLYSDPKRRRDTDLIAEDFFDDSADWITTRRSPHPQIEDREFVRYISKSLAHLTWDRVTRKPEWKKVQIAWELSKGLDDFVERVPERRLAKVFLEDARAIVNEMRSVVDEIDLVERAKAGPLYVIHKAHDFWANRRRGISDKS